MLSKSSVDRSISPQAHMQAVGNLDRLFPLALRRETRPDRKQIWELKAIHHFEVPMPFDGDVLRVKIMAKEYTQADVGTRLYLVQAIQITEARSSIVEKGEPTSPEAKTPTTPISVLLASFERRFARLLAAVKGDDFGPKSS